MSRDLDKNFFQNGDFEAESILFSQLFDDIS